MSRCSGPRGSRPCTCIPATTTDHGPLTTDDMDRTATGTTETSEPPPSRRSGRGRFSVVELIAVVALLGILAAFVVFAVQNSNQASTTESCVAEAKTIHTAIAA